jgi:quercetin dioxygenase-like cupin family protein
MSKIENYSTPFELSDSIQIQYDAVVSKTIINKPTGTVTLFGFDAGQSLSEHTAPYDALVILIEGEADISIAGQWSRVKGGQSILLPANKPHALKAVTPYKMMLVMIKE